MRCEKEFRLSSVFFFMLQTEKPAVFDAMLRPV